MVLWHNPACSKSNEAKALLESFDVDYRERLYLENPPSAEELGKILDGLGMEPWQLARTNEPLAKRLGMRGWPPDREQWLAALVENPSLIQRPILVLDNGKAVIGRPAARLIPMVARA